MTEFDTMHVFGFGDCQLIKGRDNKLVPASEMTTLPAFVAYAKSLRPPDILEAPYIVIHVFHEDSLRYYGDKQDIETDDYTISWDSLDLTTIYALADEIKAYVPPAAS